MLLPRLVRVVLAGPIPPALSAELGTPADDGGLERDRSFRLTPWGGDGVFLAKPLWPPYELGGTWGELGVRGLFSGGGS